MTELNTNKTRQNSGSTVDKLQFNFSEMAERFSKLDIIPEGYPQEIKKIPEDCEVPHRFRGKKLGDFVVGNGDQHKAYNLIVDYVNNIHKALSEGRSLILYGPCGTGKTHAAVGILRAAIENGKTGRFITASEAIERVKDSYNTGGSYKLINKLTKRDLLIIDDLGAHKTSEHDSMVLHRIICGRYDNQNSTIITTNLSLAELEATIGERTVDRLRENNGMVIIMSWASYRSAKS